MTDSLQKNTRNALIFLRILIGWHFLYEGIIKFYNPAWTAKGYLLSSEGFMKGFFVWLAGDGLIGAVDFLNMLGLTLVGLGLIIGLLEKAAAITGAIILFFYYLSHPAFPGMDQIGTEGNYWLVNKNLIEAAALLVLYYLPTGKYFGISGFFHKNTKTETAS